MNAWCGWGLHTPALCLGRDLGRGLGAAPRGSPSLRSRSQLLYEEWASYGVFYKYQPIDLVR